MERRLILMRHAKSSWVDEALPDHARPLNARGRRDAPRAAAALAKLGWIPDALVSSDSERTFETWGAMRARLDVPELRFTRRLYHAGLSALREEAAAWSPGWGCVLLLGHNPGWEEILHALTGSPGELKTAYSALLLGAGETWEAALNAPWRLEQILAP